MSLKADKGAKHIQTVQVSSLQVGHFLILSGLGDRGESPKAVCWASLNEGCIEIAPLFFRLLPTKGLFPIQDTRSLDNIDTGTSRPHSGGGLVQQTRVLPLCANLSTPQRHFNTLCGMRIHTQKQMHSHANSHKMSETYAGLVSVSVVWQWESWHHCAAVPPPSPLRAVLFSLVEWAQWMPGNFSLSLFLFYCILLCMCMLWIDVCGFRETVGFQISCTLKLEGDAL